MRQGRHTTRRRRPVALACAIAAASAIAACGSSDDEREASLGAAEAAEVIEAPQSGELAPGEAREFWTDKRIDQALANPTPLPVVTDGEELPPTKPEGPREGTPAGSAPDGGAGINPVEEVGNAPPAPDERTGPPEAPPADAPGDAGFLKYHFDNEAQTPWRTNGRLFSYYANSKYPATCSATAVYSRNQSLVVTAGHCIYDPSDGDGWATRVLFVPGYRNGSMPYGAWPVQYWTTLTGWTRDRNFNYDVAMLSTYRNPSGATLHSVIGYRGMYWNYNVRQYWAALGYPGGAPYDGTRMFACDSAYRASYGSGSGPANMEIDCDMTPGSSGGGWMFGGLYGTHIGSVNSNVNSRTAPTKMRGPYFGDAVAGMYSSESVKQTTVEPAAPQAKQKKKKKKKKKKRKKRKRR